MAGNVSVPGARVSDRLLAILGTFDPTHRAQRPYDIAERADLPLSTVYRLVAVLAEWGALTKREDGSYVVGRRLWDLGQLAPARTDLRAAASPFLHDLYGATLATVHFAVRDGTEVLYLDRLAGHASVPVVSEVGGRLPLHATGVGKALLAYAPPDVQQQVFANLTRITPYTITAPGRLRRELAAIRQHGFAQTVEEMSLGACSVAVPVRGPGTEDGRDTGDPGDTGDTAVVAALGIVVPSLRRDRAKLVSALSVAAQGIRRTLAQVPAP
ncbi:MAG TPA: IclR family transcriptional regulator [Aldersonia sp.]